MKTTLPDTAPITDAASSAASVVRDAFDQVSTDDLPDLSSVGDEIVDVVDAVGDVAVKSVGVVAGAATAIASKLNRKTVLIGGAVVIGGIATWAVLRKRRAESPAGYRAGDETVSGPSHLAAAS